MREKGARLYIGTSGWSYPHWEGIFYPEGLTKRKWLEFYTGHFNTVELNSSFYHLPKESTFSDWYERTPKGFLFAVKVSRFISHVKYLKDCKEPWLNFYQRAKLLKEKLGPFLIQLPPNWEKDLERLKDFARVIKEVSPKERFGFEFRNESWFVKEVYEVLEDYNLALVLADTPYYPYVEKITADFVYLRLHGSERLYASRYSTKQLKGWAKKIKNWQKKGLNVYCYFDNDAQGFAVENAKELLELCEKKAI